MRSNHPRRLKVKEWHISQPTQATRPCRILGGLEAAWTRCTNKIGKLSWQQSQHYDNFRALPDRVVLSGVFWPARSEQMATYLYHLVLDDVYKKETLPTSFHDDRPGTNDC
jgi:hypothetical protein